MALTKLRHTILAAALAALSAGIATVVWSQAVTPGQTKSSSVILESFRPVVREASQSTVQVKVKNADASRDVVLGTVLSSDGWILTKGSEIIGHAKVLVVLPALRGGGTREVEAKFTGYYEPYDLAMLKVETGGIALTAAQFADTSEPSKTNRTAGIPRGGRGRGVAFPTGPIPAATSAPAPPEGAIAVDVGELVVTPSPVGSYGKELNPKAYGVISVPRRQIPYSSGVMGVALADAANAAGATVTEVFMKSGAEKAGIKVDDIITAVDGKNVTSRIELQTILRGKRPADKISISITRGGQSMTLAVQLGDTILATREDVEMDYLSGQTNLRASGFPSVFQHDTVIAPQFMGGPLVDLQGRVIAINIARAGRTETYAIPADLLIPRIMQAMKDGDFPAPKK